MTTTANETAANVNETAANVENTRDEKKIIKAVSSVINSFDKLDQAFGKTRDMARNLLELNGYSDTINYKLNVAALKISKNDVYKGLILVEMFSIGDGSAIDKRYKAIASALEQVSFVGRNHGKEQSAGNTTGTKKAAKKGKEEKTEDVKTVIVERAEKPVIVPFEELEDLECRHNFSEFTTLNELFDCYEEEIFSYLAAKPERMERFAQYKAEHAAK